MFKRKSKSRGRGSRTSKRGAGGADSYSVDGGSSIDASLPRSCLKRSAVPSAAAAARTPPALLNVRFLEVQVREFERIIGDNPSCSSGAPIGLGWKHMDAESMPLDDFEQQKRFRETSELVLTRQDREQILVDWGATFNEIIEAIRANVKAKHQRRRTVNNIGTYDRWEEVMENTRRKIKRTLLLKPKNDPWSSSSTSRPPTLPSRNEESSGASDSVRSAPEVVTIQNPEDKPCKRLSRSSSMGDLSAAALELEKKAKDVNSRDAPPRMPSKRSNSVQGQDSTEEHSDALSLSTYGSVSTASRVILNMGPAAVMIDRDNNDESEGHSFASDFDLPSAVDDSSFASPDQDLPNKAAVALDSEQTRHLQALTPDDSPKSPASYYIKYENVSVQTPVSNMTSAYGSHATTSSADGNFETLTRDVSFWEMRPGQHDSPQIRRKITPVIICEDNADVDMLPPQPLHHQQQQQLLYHPLTTAAAGPPPAFMSDQHHYGGGGFVNATAYNVVDGNYNHIATVDNHFGVGSSGWENGFGMPPPPNSTVLISHWE